MFAVSAAESGTSPRCEVPRGRAPLFSLTPKRWQPLPGAEGTRRLRRRSALANEPRRAVSLLPPGSSGQSSEHTRAECQGLRGWSMPRSIGRRTHHSAARRWCRPAELAHPRSNSMCAGQWASTVRARQHDHNERIALASLRRAP
jgi:hypothetical protein